MKCKSKVGIKTISITDVNTSGVHITDLGYDHKKFYEIDFNKVDKSEFKSHHTQAITITFRPDKREIWEKLGYKNEQDFINNLHSLSIDGSICYTHNCNPEICMKNKY